MRIKRKILFLSLCLLGFFTWPVYAVPTVPGGMPNGGCWGDPVTQLHIKMELSHQFNDTSAGSEGYISFTANPSTYGGYCYSETVDWPSGYREAASFYKVDMGDFIGSPSDINPGYFKLSEDVDIQIQTTMGGGAPFEIPFANKYINKATDGPSGPGVTSIPDSSIGSSGGIYLKLRHDVIGGGLVLPSGSIIAQFYKYVTVNQIPDIPVFRLITDGGIIPMPDDCEINAGNDMVYNLGDRLDSSVISTDGSRYQMPVDFDMKCKNNITQAVNINLIADSASFNSKAIHTTNDDIGVVMIHDGNIVAPGESFPSMLNNGSGHDSFVLAPVKNAASSSIKTGLFNASAILLITVQ